MIGLVARSAAAGAAEAGGRGPSPQRSQRSQRSRRALRARAGRGLLALVLLLLPGAGGHASPDRGGAGVELALDRERFTLEARDGRSGERGPVLRVVLGSPAAPTPGGRFPLHRVILNPAWHPGETARAAGAEPSAPSLDGPMGVAKLPFADGGEIALHGGGDPLLLGKPVSSGCVRASDADLLRLIAWLEERDVLGPARTTEEGEVHRPLLRPVHLLVR